MEHSEEDKGEESGEEKEEVSATVPIVFSMSASHTYNGNSGFSVAEATTGNFVAERGLSGENAGSGKWWKGASLP